MSELEVFGQRLHNARIMKGLSMDDLCTLLDNSISKMAISKYERGILSPNSHILIRFSEVLEQPVDYFFRPFAFQITDIKFRKRSKLPAKQENMIRETVADSIERYINIERICNAETGFIKPDWLVRSDEDAMKYALSLREQWNIGNDGILNVISLLEENGIKILQIEASGSFDGLSSYVNGCYPVIVINKTFNPERSRFTAAHELGHIMLSFEDNAEDKQVEHYCNVFASEFLIPTTAFVQMIGSFRSSLAINELENIQCQYGISKDALLYKAKACNVISQSHYEMCMRRKNVQPGFRAALENSVFPKEQTNRFESLVYRALSSGMISESKASSLLKVPQDVLRATYSVI